jgi:hypothetical protein
VRHVRRGVARVESRFLMVIEIRSMVIRCADLRRNESTLPARARGGPARSIT